MEDSWVAYRIDPLGQIHMKFGGYLKDRDQQLSCTFGANSISSLQKDSPYTIMELKKIKILWAGWI